jgi:hypothetical protein
MTQIVARKRFTEFKERADGIADAELDDFWATLEPVGLEFMTGEWAGGAFDNGHPMVAGLVMARWFGKTFSSPADVQPLVCLDEDGQKYSNVKLGKGEASLWLEEFRGEVTATMVYDGQPIHDHFKKIDDDAVMGIMNGKAGVIDGRFGYFYLERV